MYKKVIVLTFVMLSACLSASAGAPLSHIKGMHAVGLRGGTGFGQTFDVGVSYQYHFSRRWSFFTALDFEKGKFDNALFWKVKASPGVECSVWHPVSWFYMHLLGDMNFGYDNWKNRDINGKSDGFAMGLDLGFNLEFYAVPQLSFVLQAQEGWDWGFYSGGYNYFYPLFSLSVKYNIN